MPSINRTFVSKNQKEFLAQHNVTKSFLQIQNFDSDVIQYMQIDMPLLIMYEALNTEQKTFHVLEFTSSGRCYVNSTTEDPIMYREHPLHSHNFFEMMIVLSGDIYQQIESESIHYQTGDCCLYNLNVRHTEDFLAGTSFETVLFMFTDTFIKQMIKNDTLYSPEGLPRSSNNSIYHFIQKNLKNQFYQAKEYIDFKKTGLEWTCEKDILNILNPLLMEMGNGEPGNSFFIQGYLSRLFSYLDDKEQYQMELHSVLSNKEEQIFVNASSLIEKTHGRISREQLEKKLGYNSDYLNRIVKKYTGLSLLEYGRTFCLKEAATLLTETDLKIGEICEHLGFSNRNYFNKIFTRHYGVNPSVFRKNITRFGNSADCKE